MNTFDKTSKKRMYGSYLLKYTLLFAVVSAGVFSWFLIYGRSFAWKEDVASQYAPKAVYFIQYMAEAFKRMLSGDFTLKMYDFSLGFGDAVSFHTEPIYWIFLLFEKWHIEYAYGIVFFLRLYLSGLSISLFFLYFHMGVWESLMGSMVYTFSAFALYGGMRHSHFLVSMIMLPLLLLGIEEIYRSKRWYLCTIVVAISFWCGYYFTYMNTIFMGIYFLIRFFGGEETRSVKIFFKKGFAIIGSYLLGIGIANITFFNTFSSYLTSSRTSASGSGIDSLLYYDSEWVEEVFISFLTSSFSAGKWLWLGFAVIVYFCVCVLFIRKGNWQIKSAFIIGGIFCLFPVFAYIFNGFSTVSNRWCYAFAFVAALITAKMIKELTRLSKKELLLCFCLMLPYMFVCIGKFITGKHFVKAQREVCILLFLTWIILFVFHQKKTISFQAKKRILTCSVVVMLWLSGAFRFAPYYAGMIKEFAPFGKLYSLTTDTPLKMLKNTSDGEEFFRSYSKESGVNVQGASMILDYNGIVYYSSTVKGPIIDFYRELGISSWDLVRLYGFDGRGYLNVLAGVRYEGMKKSKPYSVPYGYELVDENNKYLLYETENYLPMGYTYDRVISLEEFEKLSVTAKQEVMLQAVVVDDTEEVSGLSSYTAETINNGDFILNSEKIPIKEITCEEGVTFDGTNIVVTENDASITFTFDGMDQSETYMILEDLSMDDGDKHYFTFTSDHEEYKAKYRYNGDDHTYNTSQEDYLYNLGYSEEGKTFCTITFDKPCKITVSDISIYCQPMNEFDLLVSDRKTDSLENVKVDLNTVTGSIHASADKFLVFNIPYDAGWTAYVDGVKTKLYRGNVMFMGVPLEEGDHEIVLRYESPGMKVTGIITLVSLLLFAAALFITRKKRSI